jgi:hypothetical protein
LDGKRRKNFTRTARSGSLAAAAALAPAVVAVALLAACLYAAFAHGAVAAPEEERVQLGIAVIALVGAIAWQSRSGLRARAPVVVWAGLGLLIAFAFWSDATVLWSVAPDRTWAACNRVLTYALVLVLAISVGASLRRAQVRIADGLVLVCLGVTVFALGQKLVPGLRLSGVFSLDLTQVLTRLQQPLGYWNALALLLAMGVPAALATAVDRRRPDRLRIAASAAIVTMLVTIGFTYSRGGVLALILGLVVMVSISGARLRCLAWLGLTVVGAAPVLLVALNSHRLTASGVSLAARESAGGDLAVVLGACLLVTALAAGRLIALERGRSLTAAQTRRVGRSLAGAGMVAVVVAILAVSVSQRGLTGSVSQAWTSFTATRATSVSDPSRLLSADSENRWVWWKEAARAFGDRPVQGWGAGSFAVVHLLYRRNTLSVQQPHSVPLQFLSETGLIGAALGLGALLLLLVAGVRAVRRCPVEADRLAAAALLAIGAAYCAHAVYDWDWDIPAVTIPALLALGTLGALGAATESGREAPGPRQAGEAGDVAQAQPGRPRLRPRPRPRHRRRVATVAVSAICLAAFAASVSLPRIAAADAGRALLDASAGTPASLTAALAQARHATHLDPLSDAGLRAAATIATRRHDLATARDDLLAALRREPSDEQAWQQLAFTDFLRGDRAESDAAARRAVSLDPYGPGARTVAAAGAARRRPSEP